MPTPTIKVLDFVEVEVVLPDRPLEDREQFLGRLGSVFAVLKRERIKSDRILGYGRARSR